MQSDHVISSTKQSQINTEHLTFVPVSLRRPYLSCLLIIKKQV